METTLTKNGIASLVVSLVGVACVAYPFVFGPVGMWSIGVITIGVVLIVVSVVLHSGSTPPERDLYNRGF